MHHKRWKQELRKLICLKLHKISKCSCSLHWLALNDFPIFRPRNFINYRTSVYALFSMCSTQSFNTFAILHSSTLYVHKSQCYWLKIGTQSIINQQRVFNSIFDFFQTIQQNVEGEFERLTLYVYDGVQFLSQITSRTLKRILDRRPHRADVSGRWRGEGGRKMSFSWLIVDSKNCLNSSPLVVVAHFSDNDNFQLWKRLNR